jgi:drug/metabolite transporter (DMT)-like permease
MALKTKSSDQALSSLADHDVLEPKEALSLEQQAAGEQSPQSLSHGLTWQLAALSAHVGWGCYPVLARRLQSEDCLPEGVVAIPLFLLLLVLNVIAASFLVIYMIGGKLFAKGGVEVVKEERLPWSMKTTKIAITLCVVQFARALTNLASAKFTLARWISMMNLTTPLWSALVDRLFGKALKPWTFPAIFASAAASCLVLFAGTEDNSLSHDDLIGLFLQLLSSFCLCLYMHTIQATGGLLTEEEVLFWSNSSLIIFAMIGSLLVDAGSGIAGWLDPLYHLDVEGWVLLILFAMVVYFGAALVQQYALRQIGATGVATLMPVRLVAATVGGFVLLGEPVRNALEAFGLVLIIVIVVAYIRVSSGSSPPAITMAGGSSFSSSSSSYLPVSVDSVRGMSSFEEVTVQNDEDDDLF